MCAKTVFLSFLLLSISFQIQLAASSFGCNQPVSSSDKCDASSIRFQCVCDFTCSAWDKPCNWCYTCPAELGYINQIRAKTNKLPIFGLPYRNHTECLNINILTHNNKNCCNYFCEANIKDVCF
ncbi:uncharacterized protein LOC6642394 [Drosophila willistoni]|uniref:uncharacterized protein LOC6642394 n=1 Tax=Drosophila willistoni TaxID=7260 RepID=UPI00017D7908|nr:uncharacterized protein LOC6642394 [Drosophila willistoni]